jgi:hypothetical protein
MHDATQAGMPVDGRQDIGVRSSVVNRDGQVKLRRQREQAVQAIDLNFASNPARMLVVEAYLAHGHDTRVRSELAKRNQVELGLLQGIVADGGPHRIVVPSQLDGAPASPEIDPDGNHPRHARPHGLVDGQGGVTQLLEMEVGVYEDPGASASTTSSRRLKSACGGISVVPGARRDGLHMSCAG